MAFPEGQGHVEHHVEHLGHGERREYRVVLAHPGHAGHIERKLIQCCDGDESGGGFGFHRRFETREERAAQLEAYLAELKSEAQAVEEQLAELRD